MSETMVEVVARGIWADRNGRSGGGWTRLPNTHKAPYLHDARAALKVMREPTEEMVSAFYDAEHDRQTILVRWSAAIDRALSESP